MASRQSDIVLDEDAIDVIGALKLKYRQNTRVHLDGAGEYEDADDPVRVHVSGKNANVRIGGDGVDGDLELLGDSNKWWDADSGAVYPRIHLDASGTDREYLRPNLLANLRAYLDGDDGQLVLGGKDGDDHRDGGLVIRGDRKVKRGELWRQMGLEDWQDFDEDAATDGSGQPTFEVVRKQDRPKITLAKDPRVIEAKVKDEEKKNAEEKNEEAEKQEAEKQEAGKEEIEVEARVKEGEEQGAEKRESTITGTVRQFEVDENVIPVKDIKANLHPQAREDTSIPTPRIHLDGGSGPEELEHLRAYVNGEKASLLLGGDGEAGDVYVTDGDGAGTAHLDGTNGKLVLGGDDPGYRQAATSESSEDDIRFDPELGPDIPPRKDLDVDVTDRDIDFWSDGGRDRESGGQLFVRTGTSEPTAAIHGETAEFEIGSEERAGSATVRNAEGDPTGTLRGENGQLVLSSGSTTIEFHAGDGTLTVEQDGEQAFAFDAPTGTLSVSGDVTVEGEDEPSLTARLDALESAVFESAGD